MSFGLAIIALIVTCVLLVAVRAGTNTSSIYSHFALCLLLTQCVYLAATQTRGTLYTYEVRTQFNIFITIVVKVSKYCLLFFRFGANFVPYPYTICG